MDSEAKNISRGSKRQNATNPGDIITFKIVLDYGSAAFTFSATSSDTQSLQMFSYSLRK